MVFGFNYRVINTRCMEMKFMKKSSFILVAVFGLMCCASDGENMLDKTTLLTSTRWTIPLDNKGEPDRKGVKRLQGFWSFKSDGTYIERFGEQDDRDGSVLIGSWKWENAGEISILQKHWLIDDKKLEFSDDDRFVLRVINLTSGNLKVVKRHARDFRNSMAKELTCIASPK